MRAVTREERVAYVAGRLDGLAGTTRYDVPEDLRHELKEIAAMLQLANRDQTVFV